MRGVVSSITAEEALGRLKPEDRRAVEEFRDGVRELLGERLADLRLFGSKARGDDGPESDIDILVLVHDLDESTDRAVLELAHSTRTWVSALVDDHERYHRPASRASGLYESMRHDSIRL